MDRHGSDAGVGELLGEILGALAGVGEEHRRAVGVDQLLRRAQAGDGVDPHEAMLGGGHRNLADEVVADRVVLVVADQLVDVTVERRRVEQRLALGGHLLEQLAHLGEEAHVGHPVGFVDDDDLDPVEGDRAALDEIEQAARAGDEDRRAAAQGVELAPVGDAAEHRQDEAASSLAERDQLIAHLEGELARRDEDDARGVVGLGAADAGEHRDAEGEGLARAGRRLDAQVASVEPVGDRRSLDGEGLGEAFGGERVGHVGGDAERGERGGHGGGCSSAGGDHASDHGHQRATAGSFRRSTQATGLRPG